MLARATVHIEPADRGALPLDDQEVRIGIAAGIVRHLKAELVGEKGVPDLVRPAIALELRPAHAGEQRGEERGVLGGLRAQGKAAIGESLRQGDFGPGRIGASQPGRGGFHII